jgi:hypothetical protein
LAAIRSCGLRWLAGLHKSLPLAINQTSLARGAIHFLSGAENLKNHKTIILSAQNNFGGKDVGNFQFKDKKV